MAAPQLSFRKTTFNLYLRVKTTRKQLTISIYGSRIFWPTFLEDSGRGMTTVSDKEIQARNEARIPQNTNRATSWSTRVSFGWLGYRAKLVTNKWRQQHFRGSSKQWNFKDTVSQWKAMNHRLSANVPQKKTLLSSILEIVASYLIFRNKHFMKS